MVHENYTYPLPAKLLHMGVALFGITAFLTGELAEDGLASAGFLIHAYLGLSLGVFLILRIIPGFGSRAPFSFSGWSPFVRRQWRMAVGDVLSLLRLKNSRTRYA